MLLAIEDNRTVGDLQDKFNECFPCLKIEFYASRHKWHQGSREEHKLSSDRKIGDIRGNHNSGIFEIKSWYKTGRVEQEFRDAYGLHVQIFFLKNGEWIQSFSADDITLARLNDIGTGGPTKRS